MGYKDSKSLKKPLKSSGRFRIILITIIRLMLIFAFFGAWYKERWLVLFVAGFAFLVTFVPFLLRRFRGAKIPAEFEIMTLIFIYGILFLGDIRGFYAEFWWWDILLNLGAAIALGLIGLTVMYALYKDEIIDASPIIVVVLAFCFAFSIGGLWEIFEFFADSIFGFSLQKGSLTDTMGDLVVNAIGVLLVSVSGYYYMKSNKKNLASQFILNLIQKNPRLFGSRHNLEESSEKILEIVERGEGDRLEFKSTLRTNLHTGEFDKKIEHSVLKTVVAYLNSNGGILLVGVSDKGEITGLEKDKFPDNDKLNLYFTNLIKHHIGNRYLPFIDYELFSVEDKHVLKIDCRESNKRVFLKFGQEEEFYVRNGPSSAKLIGSELIDYVNGKFGKD